MASNAAQQGAEYQIGGELAGLENMYGGQTNALAALAPYNIGGAANYGMLQSLITGNAPSYTAPATTSSVLSTQAGATPDQIAAAIATLQGDIKGWLGGSNVSAQGKYAGTLAAMEQQLAQLQQIQQQEQATGQAQTGVNTLTAAGYGPGYLSSLPQFSYNPTSDPNLQGALTLANQGIAAQQLAGGGFGSGNMATALAAEAETAVPEYEQLAEGEYNMQQLVPREYLTSLLSSNTGGTGLATGQDIANLFTGNAANASNLYTGIGGAGAAGTIGASNAWTNALTGIGNTGNSLANLYMQQNSPLYQAMTQYFQNQGGGAPGQIPWDQTISGMQGYGSPYEA